VKKTQDPDTQEALYNIIIAIAISMKCGKANMCKQNLGKYLSDEFSVLNGLEQKILYR
jgi:hypothetical protein